MKRTLLVLAMLLCAVSIRAAGVDNPSDGGGSGTDANAFHHGDVVTNAVDALARLHTVMAHSNTATGGFWAGNSVTNTGTGIALGNDSYVARDAGVAIGPNAIAGAGIAIGDRAGVGLGNNGGAAIGVLATAGDGGSVGAGADTTTGGAVGQGADSTRGGAVGTSAHANDGGAVGTDADADNGGAIGYEAVTTHGGGSAGMQTASKNGGAIGYQAMTSDGFAGGLSAQARLDATAIDAIQLGTGINSNALTLRVYSNTLLNADGTIPVARMPTLSQASADATAATNFISTNVFASTVSLNNFLYVAQTGNDTNSGLTTAAPFQTFTQALAVANANYMSWNSTNYCTINVLDAGIYVADDDLYRVVYSFINIYAPHAVIDCSVLEFQGYHIIDIGTLRCNALDSYPGLELQSNTHVYIRRLEIGYNYGKLVNTPMVKQHCLENSDTEVSTLTIDEVIINAYPPIDANDLREPVFRYEGVIRIGQLHPRINGTHIFEPVGEVAALSVDSVELGSSYQPMSRLLIATNTSFSSATFGSIRTKGVPDDTASYFTVAADSGLTLDVGLLYATANSGYSNCVYDVQDGGMLYGSIKTAMDYDKSPLENIRTGTAALVHVDILND